MCAAACRGRACHHSEDGDPWLHAPSHPGDAGELGRFGKRSDGQPELWSTARKLQPQSVPQLRPKQSSYTITVEDMNSFFLSSRRALSRPVMVLKTGSGGRPWSRLLNIKATSSSSTTQPLTPPDLISLIQQHCVGGEGRGGTDNMNTADDSPLASNKRLNVQRWTHQLKHDTRLGRSIMGQLILFGQILRTMQTDLTNTRHFFLLYSTDSKLIRRPPPSSKTLGVSFFFQLQNRFRTKDI